MQSAGEVPPVGRGGPEREYSNNSDAPFAQELGKRSGNKVPSMSVAERRASREKYENLGPTQVAELAARMFPDEVGTPAFDLADPLGASLVKTSGRFAAILKDDDTGQTGLMLSSSPVRQTSAQGSDPLDLSIKKSGDTYKAAVPLIDTRFMQDPQEAITFPGRDVSVGLATKSEREPLVKDDRATYFEAAKDTDLIITPRPQGAELYVQLRTPDAPSSMLLDVDAPKGAVLRELKPVNPIPGDTDGPWPVAVMQGDKQLAAVYPPAAHDAEGRPVQSRLSIEDGNLRLRVEHRGSLYAYPILVDPEVYALQVGDATPSASGNSQWSGWRQETFRSGYSQQYNHSPFFGSALGNGAYGPGLYLSMPTNNAYFAGDFSELKWQAPEDVFITRARLSWLSHTPFYSSTFHGITNAANNAWEPGVGYVNQNNERGPNPFGVASQAFYGPTHDFCYGSPNCNQTGSDRNQLIVGIQATPPGCCMNTSSNKATVQANGIELYLGDRYTPVLTEGIPPSQDWHDDGGVGTRTVAPKATDRGLGIRQIDLTVDGQTTTKGLGCTGHPYLSACPKIVEGATTRMNYQLGEGAHTMKAAAVDATLKPTTGGTWTEKIDRSPPVVAPLTGGLPAAADILFKGHSYDLSTVATDSLSGVVRTRVLIDGAPLAGSEATQAACDGCSMTTEQYMMPTDTISPGQHTVVVEATDKAGLTGRSQTVTVEVVAANDVSLPSHNDDDDESTYSDQPPEEADIDDGTEATDPPPTPDVCDPNATSGADTDCARDDYNSPLDSAVRAEPSLASNELFGALVAGLPYANTRATRRSEAMTCDTTPGQRSDLERGACGWGISDQKESIFTTFKADLDALDVKRLRLIVPWDAITRGRGFFSSRSDTYPKDFDYRKPGGGTDNPMVKRQTEGQQVAREQIDIDRLKGVETWLDGALPCNAPIKYEVMVTFDHTRGDRDTPQAFTLPTPEEYETALRPFMRRFSEERCNGTRKIRLYGAWNEPNYGRQPTYGPLIKNAGVYWSVANKVCHTTYRCFVPAGELVDYSPDTLGVHIRRYKEGMNRKASAWSFHGYRSSHQSLRDDNRRVRRIVRDITPGARVWFTEQGGRYDVKANDDPSPLADECRLMRLRELSGRITRFWHYQLVGPTAGETDETTDSFDSGLIGARPPEDGKRDQYDVFRFFSAKTGSGYGDKCPSSVRNESTGP